jgi:hypothetical protein
LATTAASGDFAAALRHYALLRVSFSASSPKKVHPPFGGVLSYPSAFGETYGIVL